MKKQIIYSYLQRSLVKVFTKDFNCNQYETSVIKPLQTYYTNRISGIKQKKRSHKLVFLLDRLTWHSKTLDFFQKVNIKKTKSFICKLYLKSFNKFIFISLFSKGFIPSLFNVNIYFFFYKKQKGSIFYQNFYIRKNKYKNSMKSFHNLDNFFHFFFFSRNNKINFLSYAGVLTQIKYAQQLLYLHKTYCLTCSFSLVNFYGIDIGMTCTLDSLQNKIIVRHKKERSLFELLFFFIILFDIAIKYINKKKQKFSKQSCLKKNDSIYQFDKIIDNKFISFKSFYYKTTVIDLVVNSHFIFLMRPLFSVTRLDTFFICESLKLPIYPDKSNLRVDFLRNRVRKQILPAIRILVNPQFDTILCKFNELNV